MKDLLDTSGIPTQLNPERGLDHGAWNPLLLIYPEAQIPVLQLSIQPHQDPAHPYQLGQALQPLRKEGVLILASGGATHNLWELMPSVGWGAKEAEFAASPPTWVTNFDQWLSNTITPGQVDALLPYRSLAPEAVRNHPRDNICCSSLGRLGQEELQRHGNRGLYLQSVEHGGLLV